MINKFNLTIKIDKSSNGEYFIASCDEFDIVTQGATYKEALKNIFELMHLQASWSVDHDNLDYLFGEKHRIKDWWKE